MADTSKRGFASMDDDKQREIARKGGEASHGGGQSGGSKGGSTRSKSDSSKSGNSSNRGGSHEQHVQAGRQSHKNSE